MHVFATLASIAGSIIQSRWFILLFVFAGIGWFVRYIVTADTRTIHTRELHVRGGVARHFVISQIILLIIVIVVLFALAGVALYYDATL